MFEGVDAFYIYLVVVVVILILGTYLLKEPSNSGHQPVKTTEDVVHSDTPKIFGDFTLEELKQYNGVKQPQIFMAAKGVIYDVSNSPFYRSDGAYGEFAGHDASINLSKMSHDRQLLNKWGNYSLTPEEDKILNDWVVRFEEKYRKVGVVKN